MKIEISVIYNSESEGMHLRGSILSTENEKQFDTSIELW